MKSYIYLFVLLFSAGCVTPTTSPIEAPLTKEERLKLAVNKLHSDMQTISNALERYKEEQGPWPKGRGTLQELVTTGYLKAIPTPIDAEFWDQGHAGQYLFDDRYDKMGGGPENDATIYSGYYRDEYCLAFLREYATDLGTLRSDIFDYQGNDNRYPGEVYGSEAKIYAIKFATDDVSQCEINWVIQYR